MKLIDLLTAPWAITPEKKAEIDAIYAAHCRGEKLNLELIEAANGKPLNNAPVGYDVVDGIAVIEIAGVMAKKMNLFTRISGGVSTQIATGLVNQATGDPTVSGILLIFDTPGGAVDGTQELAAAVRAAAATKPTAAVADLMASAGYWVGSAATQVYASSDVAMIGSIGVVASHVDVSAAEEKQGYKTTEITAGKFKRIASQYGPLTESGRQSIQDQVDYIYGVFLDAVASHRGLDSREQVHNQMADGRIFIGQQAVDAGLVDGIASVADVLAMLGAGDIPIRPSTGARGAVSPTRAVQGATATLEGGVPSATITQTENEMADEKKVTAEDAKAFVDAAVASATAAFEAGKPALRLEAATAERERIQAVFAQSMAGHEPLVHTLAFDGKTTGPEAAVQVLAAEKGKIAKIRTDLVADAGHAAPAASAQEPEKKPEAKGDKPIDYVAIAKKAQAYQAEQAKLGIPVSTTDAVAHVSAQEAK